MMMYRRYFWITRVAPLALVGFAILALVPSDFRAVTDSWMVTGRLQTHADVPVKVSMPPPRLIVAAVATPMVAAGPSQDVITTAASSVDPPAAQAAVAEANVSPITDPGADSGLAPMRKASIGGSGVNVRAGAGKDFAVLFTLTPGTEIKVRENLNGWVHVYADAGEGWIASSFLADSPQAAATASTQATASRSLASDSLVGKLLLLHSDAQVYASPNGDRSYVLNAGARIRVAEVADKWARIIADTGESGWVRLR